MTSQTLEHQNKTADPYHDLLAIGPKPVGNFTPSNAIDAKKDFMSGKNRNPQHDYTALEAIDFNQKQTEIKRIGQILVDDPDLNSKQTPIYESFVINYQNVTRFMELAQLYNRTNDPSEKRQLGEEYMRLNIEIFGEPDERTYRSILQEKLTTIHNKELTGEASRLRDELFSMVAFDETLEKVERFRPSDETVDWMHEVSHSLYGNMLEHVPNQETFSPTELRDLFEKIIREEFGEAASEWQVVLAEKGAAISVVAATKSINIPQSLAAQSHDMVRKLVAHEIGVHMLRAIMGTQTDLEPLESGLQGYGGAEEGLGMVMQQAVAGAYEESGLSHYVSAGAAYFDGKDFRSVYEMKWRLAFLEDITEGQNINDDMVTKKKNRAYRDTQRCFRGTGDLPWFSDLSYFNGTQNMWRHLESIRGDDLKFTFVLMGKADPTNKDNERALLDTHVKQGVA